MRAFELLNDYIMPFGSCLDLAVIPYHQALVAQSSKCCTESQTMRLVLM